jgi:small subunit ribosomal protein S1
VGQQVTVQVTKLEKDDKGRDRISLSLRALEADPFQSATEGLKEGQQLKGEVVRTEPFGAFVKLEVGIEGLVHVSELGAERRVQHAREVVQIGQQVDVLVLGVDKERRRVSLSMKAAGARAEAEQAKGYTGGSASLGTFGDLLKGKLKK